MIPLELQRLKKQLNALETLTQQSPIDPTLVAKIEELEKKLEIS